MARFVIQPAYAVAIAGGTHVDAKEWPRRKAWRQLSRIEARGSIQPKDGSSSALSSLRSNACPLTAQDRWGFNGSSLPGTFALGTSGTNKVTVIELVSFYHFCRQAEPVASHICFSPPANDCDRSLSDRIIAIGSRDTLEACSKLNCAPAFTVQLAEEVRLIWPSLWPPLLLWPCENVTAAMTFL
jgi:hypothetical protein